MEEENCLETADSRGTATFALWHTEREINEDSLAIEITLYTRKKALITE